MEVNATKGSAAAEIVAATAKAKKAAQAGDSAASMFASAVSAATKGAAQSTGTGHNNGLGALGGMFSKKDANSDVVRDDKGDTGPHQDADVRPDEAPPARAAETQHHDQRPAYDDAPDSAPVALTSQPADGAEQNQPAEQVETHTAAQADTGAQHQDSRGEGQETASAAVKSAAAPSTAPAVDGNAVLAAAAAQTTDTGAATAATAKTDTVPVTTAPKATAQEAAPVMQAQAEQSGVGAESTKKQAAPSKIAQQVASAANTEAKTDDTAALAQGTAKAKVVAKTETTQSTHQSAAQAKAGAETPGQQAQAQVQAQTQTQAQAQDLSRRLGGDQRVDVAVSVEKEADTLTSRPTVSLAASAAKSTAAAAATGRGNDAGQNGQNMAGNNQNQAQAQMAMQAQAATAQAATGPAGGNGFQAQVNAAATTQVGGIEGASATSATAGAAPGATAQQANSNAAQQAAKAPVPHHTQRAVTEQVSVQIVKAAGDGSDKISIRLNPASLGRIDVQLELGQDGRMTATIMADNKDTLDMLQKDARGLAKALQDAGMNTNSGDLNFSLRGDNAANQGKQGSGSGATSGKPDLNLIEQPLEDLLAGGTSRNVITNDRVDIRV